MHVRAIHLLEKEGLLNRAIEFLPDSRQIAERQRAGKGLTRPELAVLLAYAKIWLYEKLLASNLPDDAALQGELMQYFPETLQKKYADDIAKHQLGREIIATILTNNVVNRAGTPFVLTMSDRTGKDVVAVTRAYTAARDILGLQPLFAQIEALDNKVPAKVQTNMHLTIRRALSEAIFWLLTEIDLPTSFAPTVATYGKGVQQLATWLKKHPELVDAKHLHREAEWIADGVPAQLAHDIAVLPMLVPAFDLTRLAQQSNGTVDSVADVFFDLGKRLFIDWMLHHNVPSSTQTSWQRAAMATAFAELASIQRRIAANIIGKGKDQKNGAPREKLAQWVARHKEQLSAYDAQVQEWRQAGVVDLAMLTLAAKQLGDL